MGHLGHSALINGVGLQGLRMLVSFETVLRSCIGA